MFKVGDGEIKITNILYSPSIKYDFISIDFLLI